LLKKLGNRFLVHMAKRRNYKLASKLRAAGQEEAARSIEWSADTLDPAKPFFGQVRERVALSIDKLKTDGRADDARTLEALRNEFLPDKPNRK
jgi:hypothetical protein